MQQSNATQDIPTQMQPLTEVEIGPIQQQKHDAPTSLPSQIHNKPPSIGIGSQQQMIQLPVGSGIPLNKQQQQQIKIQQLQDLQKQKQQLKQSGVQQRKAEQERKQQEKLQKQKEQKLLKQKQQEQKKMLAQQKKLQNKASGKSESFFDKDTSDMDLTEKIEYYFIPIFVLCCVIVLVRMVLQSKQRKEEFGNNSNFNMKFWQYI